MVRCPVSVRGGLIQVVAWRHARTRPVRNLRRIHPDRQAARQPTWTGYLPLHRSTALVRRTAQARSRQLVLLGRTVLRTGAAWQRRRSDTGKGTRCALGPRPRRLQVPDATESTPQDLTPDIKRLREAGTTVAAMWFLLCGCNASIPVEPTIYDLLVFMPDGIKRVQVKTTTYNGKDGWVVQVGRRPYSVGNREGLVPYDPDLLDFFLFWTAI